MQLSKIIERVIALAEQARNEADGGARSRIREEMRAFLEDKRAADAYMLITVMYLGRGDFGTAGMMDSYQDMSDTFSTPQRAVRQMLEKSNLHEYLRAGLEKLSRAGIEVDTLLTSHVDTP